VVRNDVAAGREHHTAHIAAAFGRGSHHFHLGRRGREHPIRHGGDAQQYHHGNSAHDVAARPRRRLALRIIAMRAVDAQALQISVFSVDSHFSLQNLHPRAIGKHRLHLKP